MEQFQELRESVNPLCQFEETTKKANKRLFYQRESRRANLPTKVGVTCYETKLRPVLEYAAPKNTKKSSAILLIY
jgi:hypothetical protein